MAWQNPIEALRSAIKRAVTRKAPEHSPAAQQNDRPAYQAEHGRQASTQDDLGGYDDGPVFAPEAAMRPAEAYPLYPDPSTAYAPSHPTATGFSKPLYQQGSYPQHPGPEDRHPYAPAPHGMPQRAVPHSPAQQGQQQTYVPQQPYSAPQEDYPPPHRSEDCPLPQGWDMREQTAYAPSTHEQATPYAQLQPFGQQRQLPYDTYPALHAEEQVPVEEIRASLREFRDAVRDLADSRARRRYF